MKLYFPLALIIVLAWAQTLEQDYVIKIDGLFSSATVTAYPTARPRVNVQNLIGTSHTAGYTLFNAGAVASNGLRAAVTTGTTAVLQQEIVTATAGGTAGGPVIVDGAFLDFSSRKKFQFSTVSTFPMFSWVAPLFPSPDWFIGQSGVVLNVGGQWQTLKNVPIIFYDAGIDSSTAWYGHTPTAAGPITQDSRGVVGYVDFIPEAGGTQPAETYTMWIRITYRGFPGGHEAPRFGLASGAMHTESFSPLFAEGQQGSPILRAVAVNNDVVALNILVREAKKISQVVYDLYQGPPTTNLPSTSQTIMRASSDFPFFSFVARLDPSPDWFIGASRVRIYDGNNGGWQKISIPLYLLDAGALDGTDYYGDVTPWTPTNTAVGRAPAAQFPNPVATLTLTPMEKPGTTVVKTGTLREGLVNWMDQYFRWYMSQDFVFYHPISANYWANRALIAICCAAACILVASIFLLGKCRELRSKTWRQILVHAVVIILIFFIGFTILVGIYGKDWAYCQRDMTNVPLGAASRNRNVNVDAKIGIHVGLNGVNVTVEGTPRKQRDEIIDYNEHLNWEWTQPVIRETQLDRVVHGAPYAFVLLSSHFVWDGEGILAGRYFRYAGYNANSLLWTAFAVWMMLVFLVLFVPQARLTLGYLFLLLALILELTILLWVGLIPHNYTIHLTNEESFVLQPGWNFYLTMAAGVVSFAIGLTIVVIVKRRMKQLIFARGFHDIAGKDSRTPKQESSSYGSYSDGDGSGGSSARGAGFSSRGSVTTPRDEFESDGEYSYSSPSQ